MKLSYQKSNCRLDRIRLVMISSVNVTMEARVRDWIGAIRGKRWNLAGHILRTVDEGWSTPSLSCYPLRRWEDDIHEVLLEIWLTQETGRPPHMA